MADQTKIERDNIAQKQPARPAMTTLGAIAALSLSMASFADAPAGASLFEVHDLDRGFMIASAGLGDDRKEEEKEKGEEGACGEGACGEGSCGEGSCGEGSCGEGSCGA